MKKYAVTRTLTYEGQRYYIRGDTEAEVAAKKAILERDLKEGRRVLSKNTLVKDWTVKCIETYKTGQNANTRKKYMARIQHCILEQIGEMRLCDVKPLDVQGVMNLQTGKSPTQVKEVFQALRFIFGKAKINGLIYQDPTEGLEKPKMAKVDTRRALTPEERAVVIRVGSTDRRYYLFLLMLLCGCRPAEAQECRGSDLFIDHSILWLHIRGTKNRFADRSVPVPEQLAHLIYDTPRAEYIACSSLGNPITTENRARLWKSFVRAVNIELGCKMYRNALIPPLPFAEDIVPYCLRHEYCTELARQGVDLRIAQRLMGHSSIEMTANVYTNLTQNDMSELPSILHVAPFVAPRLES